MDKIFCINLHVAQNFGGFVTSTLNVFNHKTYTLDADINGVRVRGPKCNKLVPWGNLRDIDYILPTGELPVSAMETKA